MKLDENEKLTTTLDVIEKLTTTLDVTLTLIGTMTLDVIETDEIGTMRLDVIEIETSIAEIDETTIAETICLEMKESLLETEKMAHQLELAWPIFLKLFHRLLRLLLLIL